MIIYLAGPMSGLPEHNYPAFTAACKTLRQQGYNIVSPHEETPCQDHANPLPWTHYLRRDLRTLLDCDAIAMLPGYSGSKGAQLELTVALALGYPIYDVVDGVLVPHD